MTTTTRTANYGISSDASGFDFLPARDTSEFQIELEGLEEDNYEMGPGPILFPNAEKEVFLRLHHPRKSHPPAGEHQIHIRASAPDAYPGQSAVEPRQVNILPYYDHTLRLLGTDEAL